MIWTPSNKKACFQISKRLKQKSIQRSVRNPPTPKKEEGKDMGNTGNSYGTKPYHEIYLNQGSFRYLSFQFTLNLSHRHIPKKKIIEQ